MRLHGNDPMALWFSVWHAPQCRFLKNVIWVDDATALWCESTGVLHRPHAVHQAKRIDIHLDRKLVVIDPIDDADAEHVHTARRVTDDETT